MQNIKDYLQHISEFYEEKLKTWTKMGGGQTKNQSHFEEIRNSLYEETNI
jgi:hypothetical protein